MMSLTPEQLKLQSEFKIFVDKYITPYAAKNDVEEILQENIINNIKKKGYLGSMIPSNFGGLGFDSVTIGILNEEVGKGCSSTRSLLTVHGMVAIAINRWGTKEQKKYWLPKLAKGELIGAFALTEPNVGSDANSIETTAVLDGENYILNGNKKWITMGQIADVFLVFAKINGKTTALLVNKRAKGFSIEPMKGLLGARASMIAKLKFENCIIPKENLIGREGMGLSHVGLYSLDYGRYTIACGCVGLAQACLNESLAYCRKRVQFKVALREHQLIQKMITEMIVNIQAARLLCYNAGQLRDLKDPDSIMETWNAKYFASKMANSVASYAVQIFGAKGLSKDYPIERYFRDARVNEIIEGSSQIHESLIAKNAFRYENL
ncbi:MULTISPECIES: acyl-CoA dehydrogenase family protein [Clostridium]|uniref:acyl-CoA dehydrogenase family protein n=1 Tax=Clostridium TaxID=1485 RepID=UPI000A42ACEA|nr:MULTISPECIES: acyl-CoA dehydrogenase family protein [Clostridium]